MITKLQSNELFQTMAQAIAQMQDYRLVVDFQGEHSGETLLVDFSDCGELFTDTAVCVWSLQKQITDSEGKWGGTDELDFGSFDKYTDVFPFLIDTLSDKEYRCYLDCY